MASVELTAFVRGEPARAAGARARGRRGRRPVSPGRSHGRLRGAGDRPEVGQRGRQRRRPRRSRRARGIVRGRGRGRLPPPRRPARGVLRPARGAGRGGRDCSSSTSSTSAPSTSAPLPGGSNSAPRPASGSRKQPRSSSRTTVRTCIPWSGLSRRSSRTLRSARRRAAPGSTTGSSATRSAQSRKRRSPGAGCPPSARGSSAAAGPSQRARRDEIAARDGDGLEPRRGTQRVQQVPHMVPHRLAAEVQLLRDLRGRAATLEHLEHLLLPRCQVQLGMRVRFLHHVRHLAEHADHVLALPQRHRADLDPDSTAVGVDDDHRRVGHLCIAEDLAREQFAGPAGVLGCDDRRELAPDLIPNHLSGGAVHPADDSGAVDHVARHIHVLQHTFDVGSHRLQRFNGHS